MATLSTTNNKKNNNLDDELAILGGGKTGNTETATSKTTGYKLTITSKKDVVVRKDHSNNSTALSDKAKKGKEYKATKVYKDSSNNKWYYVEDLKGWVQESSCESIPLVTTTKWSVKTPSKNNTVIYSDQHTGSDVIKVIAPDKTLISSERVYDGTNWWYYIDQYKGWINDKDKSGITVKETKKTAQKLTKEQKEAAKKAEEAAKKAKEKELKNTRDTSIPLSKLMGKYVSYEDWVKAAKDKDIKKARQERIGLEMELKSSENWAKNMEKRYKVSKSDAVDSLLNDNLIGIFGAPYQFSEDTDEKLELSDGSKSIFGVTYANKIVTNMPLLIISPGKVDFMSNFKDSDRGKALKKLLGLEPTDSNDANELYSIEQLHGTDTGKLMDTGKYFTFAFDVTNYFKYVNGMCQTGAKFLNIDNVEITGGDGKSYSLGSFDWKKAVASKWAGFVASFNTLSFYIDSVSTVDEDFSNTLTDSQIANKINQFSDIGREIQFLLGTKVGTKPKWMTEESLEDAIKEIESFSSEYLEDNKLLVDVAKNFATVATGGKLLFPQIWADSEFIRSYNLSIKLRTPDADILSWYLNIYVPLCHLVALTAPRQVSDKHYNGYMSPFLVRAFYKGLFNCDCGIITSLNISRGKEGSWTLDGLPTEVDISLQLKDLYSVMFISKPQDGAKWFTNNSSLMDYIANNCGININEPDLIRQFDLKSTLSLNNLKQLPANLFSGAYEFVGNLGMKMYNKLVNW